MITPELIIRLDAVLADPDPDRLHREMEALYAVRDASKDPAELLDAYTLWMMLAGASRARQVPVTASHNLIVARNWGMAGSLILLAACLAWVLA